MKFRIFVPLLLAVTASLSAQVPDYSKAHVRTISITGSAEIQAPPDYAVISLNAVTENVSLKLAKEENDRRIVKAQEVAKQFGLKPADIEMQYASIERNIVNDEKTGTRKLLSYTVKKSVSLIVRDLSRFEALLNELLQAGINELEKVDFKTSKAEMYEAQAREQAIVNARDRAVALASKLGQKLGKPLTIGEARSSFGVAGAQDIGVSRSPFAAETVMPETEAGLLSFTAELYVVFELE